MDVVGDMLLAFNLLPGITRPLFLTGSVVENLFADKLSPRRAHN
jgi:hypothetical protein